MSSFWIIADAIKRFYEKHNALPLPGSVPDMKAQSTVYVQLQNIYKAKARQDAAEVLETVRCHPQGKDIDSAEVESFCKNAAFIKLIRGSESFEPSPVNIKVLAGMVQSLDLRMALVIKMQIEREFESDSNAPLTAMPLSLFPIYLSLR
jgi:NEDD8-activating enzyme E1 regulatory subunit